MKIDEIRSKLLDMRDPEYAEFQRKLLPTLKPETIVGVRTPQLRALAKELVKQSRAAAKAKPDGTAAGGSGLAEFLDGLPHVYFDEDQLHAFIISLERDFEACMARVEEFLPYVDNWATCDQLSPKVFAKHKAELLEHLRAWLRSDKTYTVRFAVGMLMEHFLDGEFDLEYPELVAEIRSAEYYVNMMRAWYFATALAKQYDAVLPFIEERRLDAWTHNKAIQKAVESYRISDEQKLALKTMRVKPAKTAAAGERAAGRSL